MLGALSEAWSRTPSEVEEATAEDVVTMLIFWRVRAALTAREGTDTVESDEGTNPSFEDF